MAASNANFESDWQPHKQFYMPFGCQSHANSTMVAATCMHNLFKLFVTSLFANKKK